MNKTIATKERTEHKRGIPRAAAEQTLEKGWFPNFIAPLNAPSLPQNVCEVRNPA